MFRMRSLLTTLLVMCLVASFAAFASQAYAPPYSDDTYGDGAVMQPYPQPDPLQSHVQATMVEQAMAARNASLQAQQTTQDVAITRMTGTQDFILKLTAIVMPLLIAMMTGLMLYIQIKQKAVMETISHQQREDLILVARSVNGVKTELVAKAELAAFLEGLHMQSQGDQLTPDSEQRLTELKETVRHATEKAEATASNTVSALVEKQGGKVTLPAETLKAVVGVKP